MSDQLKVYCKNIEEYIPFKGGDTLMDIYNTIADRIPEHPICAHVNNKTEDLQFPLFAPKQVEFLTRQSPSGHRVYVRSLCMMLYKSVVDLFPGVRLIIEHSISRGYYCRLTGDITVNEDVVARLKARMTELVKRDIKFERKERLTSDVIKIFEKQGLDDKVKLLRSTHELYTVYYRLDNVCDSYYGNLAPSTGMLNIFDLQLYKDGFLLLGADSSNPSMVASPIVQEKMYHAFTDYLAFNRVIGVDNVGELNEAVASKESAMLINVAEALHDKKIGRISDDISRRYAEGGARIVLIAGPSSSGKTTFTKRLAIQLMTNLLEPKMISLDDYFVNREVTPRDIDGDYDYESLYALDLETFNSDLNALIAGEEVNLPTYNFELGHRVYKGKKLKLNSNSVLLIEGIHGLNPELTAHIDAKMKYLIYVSALTTLSIDDHNWVPTTDNRLLRRIIRDYKYRGVSATDTIKRWPSVRRGEEKWIFPFQENADAMFNSSLIFELGVMKELADDILNGVPRDIREYAEAYRLRKLLSYFTPITDRLIPSTSLLREFLGGSSFHY
ncbi:MULTISPECIES: nucleoside kinase [unclassified Muribaculum]|jgi:uridine kinase|uniref:nucleoside kinase n=4 Tax=Muribaculaceae TaxID=2005473 RepID=UPI000F45FC70|nr:MULTISPECIES: nucleoside kinase [unclassified Muribaculum]MCX4277453.1 nucleoside kinase [Muribaculum sp.]ROT15687.1 nucleoside kinase [Muribaculaceae bacterium Isolate-102 (HZI)]TGY04141.1 nucleoside kinase [Muribaculum sp. NM65_B17]THG43200.1 nucleoside kinase [Muribaculaceae bacterium]